MFTIVSALPPNYVPHERRGLLYRRTHSFCVLTSPQSRRMPQRRCPTSGWRLKISKPRHGGSSIGHSSQRD